MENQPSNINQSQIFISTKMSLFATEDVALIKRKLEGLSDDQMLVIMALEFRDPTVMLLISIFLGELGVDRFMLKETGMGVLKLLTLGVCGILWLIDIFTVMGKARKYNLQLINNALIGLK